MSCSLVGLSLLTAMPLLCLSLWSFFCRNNAPPPPPPPVNTSCGLGRRLPEEAVRGNG